MANSTGEPHGSIQPDEALRQIELMRGLLERTRERAASAYPYFLLWGVIWTAGYAVTHWASWIWRVLVPLGFVATALIAWSAGRRAPAPPSPLMKQILWLNLVCWAVLVALLFMLVSTQEEAAVFWPVAIGVLYVLTGIFLGRELVLIGAWLVVAGTAAAALFATTVHPLVALWWLAGAGGGGLLCTGILLRRQLR